MYNQDIDTKTQNPTHEKFKSSQVPESKNFTFYRVVWNIFQHLIKYFILPMPMKPKAASLDHNSILMKGVDILRSCDFKLIWNKIVFIL